MPQTFVAGDELTQFSAYAIVIAVQGDISCFKQRSGEGRANCIIIGGEMVLNEAYSSTCLIGVYVLEAPYNSRHTTIACFETAAIPFTE